MIVIINGPLGIGKTETSWELLYHFERAVMLDGDYIGAVVPFEIYDEERVEYLYKTIRHLVAFHVENGYRNFVINYVFEQPESLGRLHELLADLDGEIYTFRLTCSEEEIARRIHQRGAESEQLDWELKRFGELVMIQEKAARNGDLGVVIDTSHLSARHGAYNVRVFGSRARGQVRSNSDLDLMVEVNPSHSPWFPTGLIADLEKILACKVDVVTTNALDWYIREEALREAQPL